MVIFNSYVSLPEGSLLLGMCFVFYSPLHGKPSHSGVRRLRGNSRSVMGSTRWQRVIGDGMRNAGRKPMGCCHKLPFKTIQWSLETRIALLSVVILYSHYIPTISLEYPGICPWIPAVVFTGSSFGWEFCPFSEACMEAFAMWGEKEEDGETCLGLTEFHYQSLSGG